MKVTFLNTFEKEGGAGVAADRIYRSLKNFSEIDLQYLFQFKSPLKNYQAENLASLMRIGLEKSLLYYSLKDRKNLFSFETGLLSSNLFSKKAIKEADILHLHWINQGFLSLKTLKKLVEEKKIIWTLHDLWPVTGGCQYPGGCSNYEQACGFCPLLKVNTDHDLSRKIWLLKNEIFSNSEILLVGPSQWMVNKIKESAIARNARVICIPNPIDIEQFRPDPSRQPKFKVLDSIKSRIQLLFGAYNLDDSRKGLGVLKYVVDRLYTLNPEIAQRCQLVLFGKLKDISILKDLKMDYQYIGSIHTTGEMRKLYQESDLYIHGASEDNLPNMLLEAMACGTPAVAFNVGGIADIIEDGVNGRLVNNVSAVTMAEVLLSYLTEPEKWSYFRENARKTIIEKFSPQVIAKQYESAYLDL